MSVSRALFLKESKGEFELGTKAIPTPGPGEILVKPVAVGLNPVDWKIKAYDFFVSQYPAVLGIDVAGEVETLGEGVTQFKKGEKVFHQGGFTGGDDGAYQEYVLVPAEIVSKLPTNITFEQAATFPLALGTAVVPLYSPAPGGVGLKAPWDGGRGSSAGQPILILGGSSSVGQYVIQLARLSGFSPIIATASLRHTELLKSLGATHVVDRNLASHELAAEIARIAAKPILLVYDAIASKDTQQLGYDVLAEGGHIVSTLKFSANETPGSTKKVLGVAGSLRVPANRAVGQALAQHLTVLVEAGDIVPNQVEIVSGGLNGIPGGLERLRNNLVSAKKLVIRVGETA